MTQLPLRLHVHVRKFDITCDPHSPASALISQAKVLSAAHPTITLEALFNKSRRCVVDLRQPIHTSISPHDEVEATSNLLVPDDTFADHLPPSVQVGTGNSSHRFFQQLCALDGMGQQVAKTLARQDRAKTQDAAQFASLLHLYYATPFDDNGNMLPRPALASAPRRDSHHRPKPPSPSADPSSALASPAARPHHAIVDEFDVVFTKTAIGLKLAMDPTRTFPTVQECLPASEASLYSTISSGVAILTVNGDSVVSIGLTKTLAKLREAPRPLVVRFGHFKSTTASWHDVL